VTQQLDQTTTDYPSGSHEARGDSPERRYEHQTVEEEPRRQ
jgi:hypothetical protein